MNFVMDASAALRLVLPDEATSTPRLSELLQQGGALAPPMWPTEVANGLVMAIRRKRLTPADAERSAQIMAALPVTIVGAGNSIRDLAAHAQLHGLTAYDAGYLLLAITRGVPLATADADLAATAEEIGVPIVPW